jgi:DNA polymerase III epsilon subunit-like protein
MVSRILFLDTETTGLPKFRGVNALDRQNNWPDIVSVAWLTYENGVLVNSNYSVIKPEWPIPEESIKIHGITQDYAAEHGQPLIKVLNDLGADLAKADYVVAHNLEFDKNVIFNALRWRLDINPWLIWPQNEICTMERARNELKLPSNYRNSSQYKPPSLTELYKDTFNTEPENMHNSLNDTIALAAIYMRRWPTLSA